MKGIRRPGLDRAGWIRSGRARLLVGAVAALALFGAACSGDTQVTVETPQQTGISVTGTGTVTVVPDIAELSLGVEVTRPTVAEAREAAAATMQAIRESLAGSGVEESDIQTQYFSIQPQYDFSDNGPPEITGFIVSNIVIVKVREIDNVSVVLDDAVEAGGDSVRVNNVAFTVDDPEQYFSEARKLAVADARARADELASEAGVSVGQVRSISEFGGFNEPPIPFIERAADAQGGAATPFTPGEAEITLSVSVVFDVDE